MRIVAFHLLNDFSGSPKVLKQLLKGWQYNEIKTCLFINKTNGFLSDLPQVDYHYFPYKFSNLVVVRIIRFFYSQFILFFKALFFLKKTDIVYCNTILPFAAAIVGKLKGCKVVYHIHETNTNRQLLDLLVLNVVIKICATRIIYVSNFVATKFNFKVENCIISNALENDFIKQSKLFKKDKIEPKNVLMICSLKEYKGINEFLKLAEANPHLDFELVVNASQKKLDEYFSLKKISSNLALYPKQNNVHPFYQKADLVLNLTRVDLANETFGLTVIEAMAYGLPVIVPPIGGISELVQDGVNGFKVDSRNIAELSEKLNRICEPEIYNNMAASQLKFEIQFEEEKFIQQNLAFIIK